MANPLALVWDLIANDAASPGFLKVSASADAAAASTERAAVGTDEAAASMDRAGVSAEKTGGIFAMVADHLGEIAVVAGAIDLGKHAISDATQFQSSMLLIKTQANDTTDNLKTMSNAVLGLSGQVAQSPEALANSLYHVTSVGLRAADALNVVKIAAEGAKVGHANLEDTTNALTAAFASGIPGVQNMSEAMGALNAIVGAGDMKMSDLNDAMSTGVLVTVKQYGLNINDVGAALADFGDNNIRGADAATKLRMAVQAFAAPMKSGADAFASIGLNMTQLATDMQTGGLNKALTDLHDHLQAAGDTGAKAGQILTEMFGKKAGSGVLVLDGTYSRFEQKLGQVKAGAAGFQSAWEQTTQTVSFQFDRLKDGLDALMIKAGTVLLPIANEVATGLGNGVAAAAKFIGKIFGDLEVDVQNFIVGFEHPEITSALGKWQNNFIRFGAWVGKIVAEVKTDVDDFILGFEHPQMVNALGQWQNKFIEFGAIARKVFDDVKKWIADTAAFMASHMTLVRDVLIGAFIGISLLFAPITTSVIIAVGLIIKYWTDLKGAYNDVRDVIKTVIDDISGYLNAHHKEVKLITDDLMAIWHDVEGVVEDLVPIFQFVFELIASIVVVAAKVIIDLWDRFGKELLTHLETAFNSTLQILRGLFEVLKGVFDLFAGILTLNWSKMWTGLKEIFGGLWNVFLGVFKFAWNELSTVVGLTMAIISEAWGYAWGLIKTIWAYTGKPVIDAVSTALSWLWHDVTVPALNGVKDAWNTVWGALKDAWNVFKKNTWDPMVNVVNGIGDVFKTAFGIVATGVEYIWDHSIKPIIDKVTAGVNGVKDAWNFLTGGGTGGSATPVSAGAVGGQTAHGGVGARALGGPVSAGYTYLVGENGPELATFGTAGFITDALATQKLMANRSTYTNKGTNVSGATVNNYIYQQPGQDPASLAAVISRTTVRSIGH